MNKEKILNILKNISAIIVVIAMFVVVFYQNRDRDAFDFGKEDISQVISSTQSGDDTYYGGDIGRVGDSAAFLTTTAYSVIDKDSEIESFPIAISKPQIHTEGEWAACYDAESKEVTVFKGNAQSYIITTNNKILSAKVNKNGYLFTATEKEGYNCECMVYNRKGEAVFKWDISKSEFLDGDINSSNNAIAITLASAGDSKLVGEVELIDITTAKVINKAKFDSQIFYVLNFNSNDTFALVGNKSLAYFNSDGTSRWEYDFGDRTLLKADITDHDKMVLAFADASISKGKVTNVIILDRLGSVSAEKEFSGTIDAISQNDDSIALAFGKKVYITNAKLREKRTAQADYNIKKLVLYKDSRHLFVLGNSGGNVIE